MVRTARDRTAPHRAALAGRLPTLLRTGLSGRAWRTEPPKRVGTARSRAAGSPSAGRSLSIANPIRQATFVDSSAPQCLARLGPADIPAGPAAPSPKLPYHNHLRARHRECAPRLRTQPLDRPPDRSSLARYTDTLLATTL